MTWTKTDLLIRDMAEPGKASCIIGGQWGSESKGSAAAWLAQEMMKRGCPPAFVTTNAGVQSGHTSIHKDKRRVSFHMPTAPWVMQDEGYLPTVYLNAGSIIDPDVFLEEAKNYEGPIYVHPMAAIITDECREAENRKDSAQTKIASTRKGVGEALARKIARSGKVAKDCPQLADFIRRIDLNWELRNEKSVLVEVPQGVSLSLNHSQFYPYCTSRDITPANALADAGTHPLYVGAVLVVLRTFPIRVGNIVENGETLGQSGAFYPGQKELTWEELGQDREITTVTKRVRRVFTWSTQQLRETFALCRPDTVFLTFCNYLKHQEQLDMIESDIYGVSKELYMPPPRIIYEFGPSTADVGEKYDVT